MAGIVTFPLVGPELPSITHHTFDAGSDLATKFDFVRTKRWQRPENVQFNSESLIAMIRVICRGDRNLGQDGAEQKLPPFHFDTSDRKRSMKYSPICDPGPEKT